MSPRPYMSCGESHTRADNWPQEEELCQQEMPKEWIPDFSDAQEIKDPINREFKIRGLQYDAVSFIVPDRQSEIG
jgi:hypothetical protein